MNYVINQGLLCGFTVFFLFFLLQHKFFCNFVRDYSQTDSLASAFQWKYGCGREPRSAPENMCFQKSNVFLLYEKINLFFIVFCCII